MPDVRGRGKFPMLTKGRSRCQRQVAALVSLFVHIPDIREIALVPNPASWFYWFAISLLVGAKIAKVIYLARPILGNKKNLCEAYLSVCSSIAYLGQVSISNIFGPNEL